jgi:hypothetical protein
MGVPCGLRTSCWEALLAGIRARPLGRRVGAPGVCVRVNRLRVVRGGQEVIPELILDVLQGQVVGLLGPQRMRQDHAGALCGRAYPGVPPGCTARPRNVQHASRATPANAHERGCQAFARRRSAPVQDHWRE